MSNGRADRKSRTVGRVLWLLPALLLLALTLTLGTALARYIAEQRVDLTIASAAEQNTVYLRTRSGDPLENGAWSGWGALSRLDFALCNAESAESFPQKEQSTTLWLAATVNADTATTVVRLLVGGEEYLGTPKPITEGTVFWRQHGAGDLYRFYNQAGEELVWTLEGGKLSQIDMSLLVTGAAEGTVFTLMTARAAD